MGRITDRVKLRRRAGMITDGILAKTTGAGSIKHVLGGNVTESPPHVRSQKSVSTREGRPGTQRIPYRADPRWPEQTPATLSAVPPATDAPRPVQEGETPPSPPSRAPWFCAHRFYRVRLPSRRKDPPRNS